MSFRLIEADCIEAMREMAESSVDSIVCDPPYGLEFMGKEWDRLGDVRQPGDETFTDVDNPYGRSKVRYGYDVPLAAMQEWHHAWATEALRILKPGGHLLAFGGTRTYHRLACAIEDAGFEIRDCLAWMYGSGFPKSLDVSKAIDKANGDAGRVLRFTAWMRTTGLTARQIDEATGTNMGGHYLTAAAQPAIPTAALWAVLRPMCGDVPGWVDELVERIEAEREVLGQHPAPATPRVGTFNASFGEALLTAPATPDAHRWNGWGTALKPAFEPIVLARKPLSERNVAANVQRWGTGALNIDGTRIGFNGEADEAESKGKNRHGDYGTEQGGNAVYGDYSMVEARGNYDATGRWPANVVLGHSPDCREVGTRTIAGKAGGSGTAPLQTVGADNSRPFHAENEARPKAQAADVEVPAWECAPGCPVAMLDEQTGESTSAGGRIGKKAQGAVANVPAGEFMAGDPGYGDTGGASRFFYCPKADREERNRGVEHLSAKALNWSSGEQSPGTFQAEGTNRTAANHHPTVKPVELMRWLCRMVTPKGGIVLDPFTGSGSTGVAAMREGFEFVGIEREAEYVEIARARIFGDAPLFNVEAEV